MTHLSNALPETRLVFTKWQMIAPSCVHHAAAAADASQHTIARATSIEAAAAAAASAHVAAATSAGSIHAAAVGIHVAPASAAASAVKLLRLLARSVTD
jgi:hypothetical protein